jgi:hypothetical protein
MLIGNLVGHSYNPAILHPRLFLATDIVLTPSWTEQKAAKKSEILLHTKL